MLRITFARALRPAVLHHAPLRLLPAGGQVRWLKATTAAASTLPEEALETSLSKEERRTLKKEERDAQVAGALYESLSPKLKSSLTAMKINSLFPVQVQTLELCRAGKDMVVRSKTGSGKTIAFALPTIENLLNNKAKAGRGTPRAIVLAPTRELAIQVHREFEKLAPFLTSVAIYGGAPVGAQAQSLRQAVDIVIGTPGRVKDFIDRGTLDLSQVSVAILDEADEMLKVGFYEAIQEIYESMPAKSERQNLLFSATVSREIRQICDSFLNKPTFIDLVGDDTSKIPDTVEMCVTPVVGESRADALSSILAAHSAGSTKENPKRALVFCSTKRECEELARSFHSPDSTLSGGALHGDMSQAVREDMLSRFRNGSCLVLVATDVAARGLDIPQVDLVIHYSLPRDHDSFVHRSGRTGRAGRRGTNIILFDPSRNSRDLRELERSVGMNFTRRAVPCGPEVVRKQAEVVAENLVNISGSILSWVKPVADELRKKDAEKGTDSLAAALAALLGGTTRLKVFSALNGRSGNQTLKIEHEGGKKLSTGDITVFMQSLPVFQTNGKTTLIRDLHRVKNTNALLVDVPAAFVTEMLEKGKDVGLTVETVEGVVPDSYSDYEDNRDTRRAMSQKNGGYGGQRDSYDSSRGQRGDSSYRGGSFQRRSSSQRGGNDRSSFSSKNRDSNRGHRSSNRY